MHDHHHHDHHDDDYDHHDDHNHDHDNSDDHDDDSDVLQVQKVYPHGFKKLAYGIQKTPSPCSLGRIPILSCFFANGIQKTPFPLQFGRIPISFCFFATGSSCKKSEISYLILLRPCTSELFDRAKASPFTFFGSFKL